MTSYRICSGGDGSGDSKCLSKKKKEESLWDPLPPRSLNGAAQTGGMSLLRPYCDLVSIALQNHNVTINRRRRRSGIRWDSTPEDGECGVGAEVVLLYLLPSTVGLR